MYIKTKDCDETAKIEEIFITSPRFDIEDVKKIKAFIRFNISNIVYGENAQDINTILKFGRVRSIIMASGALQALNIRVAGKDKDTIYHVTVQYNNGKCSVHVARIGELEKFSL